MQNIVKTTGTIKASTPNSGGANPRLAPVFGVVKNNIDPNRMGKLQVYIADFGSNDPNDQSSWCTVSYMSPFYGFVRPTSGETGFGDYVSNPSSYGVWNSPPDIGTTVVCIFINGDLNYGFYIGCVPEPDALHMVPAIGASDNIIANTEGEANGYGGATRLPVTNINTNNKGIADSNNFLNQPKPIHSYVSAIMNQQGLIRDALRGPISSSSQRESPSRVGWGISTPGRPIYEGGYTDETIASAASEGANPNKLRVISRRGGHSIVMDDGDLIGRDQLIRIRSAAGHQILLSDDGQTLFIVHSNGQSYIELGKEGTIDMYSTNSFNVRTQGDINLHADNNISINAAKQFNLYADEININSNKNTNQIVGQNHSIYSKGTFTYKIDGSMSMFSKAEASYASSSTMFVNGSIINLNTGSTSVVPQIVQPISFVAHTDTLYDKTKGYAAAPGKLISITSRAPAHMPWANAGQGVDVRTSSDAATELPSVPSTAVENINNESANISDSNPVTSDIISSVPPVKNISKTLDSNVTAGLLGAVSKNAASGLASFVVKNGAGIIPTSQGNIVSVGKFAFNPSQLEKAGIIKPGSSALVNSLVNSGKTLKDAMPANIFTGKNGVSSLEKLVKSKELQIETQIDLMKKSETDLKNSGVIKGNEDGASIAGLVLATSSSGITNVVNAVKNSSEFGSPAKPNKLLNKISGVLDSVKNAIKTGNSAAKVANNINGPYGSVADAANSADPAQKTKNASASAFGAILSSFKPLKVGVPQNLTQIANKQNAENVSKATGDDKTAQAALQAVGQVTGIPIKQISNYVKDISNASDPSKALKATSGLLGTLSNVTGNKSLSNVSRTVNSAAGLLNSINKLNSSTNPTQAGNAVSNIINDVGRISNSAGNPELSKNLRTLNSLVRAGTSAAGSIAKLNSSTNPAQAIRNVSGVVTSIGRIGSVLGEPSLNKTANSVNTILNSTGQILRSAETLASNKNPNVSTASVSNIVNNVNRITSALSNSSKSTGLNALPGAQYSTGAVVNKTLGKVNLPGTNLLSSAIKNISTAKKNEVSVQTTIDFSDESIDTGQVTNPNTNIKQLATGNLPPAAVAQLNAAIASASKSSANPIKMPTVAVNTNNRASLEQQTKALLGNAKIPLPNFSGLGPSDAAKSALEKSVNENNALTLSFSELIEENEKVEAAKREYYEIENTYPPGDPQIEESRLRWINLKQSLDNKFKSLISL
jgi:hypothetical protein